jgi:hypothetical protein
MKTLKLVFASLLDNGVAIKGKDQPWFVALILFVASVVLATYPTFNQISARTGSDFLNGTLFSVDVGLQALSEELYQEDVDLVIKETTVDGEARHTLVNESSLWGEVFTQSYDGFALFPYFEYAVTGSSRLRVFYQGSTTDAEATEFINVMVAFEKGDDRLTSFMFLGRNSVYMYMYSTISITNETATGEDFVNGFSGTYDVIPLNTNIANFIALDSAGAFVDPLTAKATDYQAYADRTFNNWKTFFDQSFAYSKSVLLWAQTALTFVVNIIMSFLMTVVIYIMTRGKLNPNRTMTFLDSIKIGSWTLLSPALLTIVAGSLFPEFAPTAFVLFVGLRLMWLSSKYLRPLEPIQTVVKK